MESEQLAALVAAAVGIVALAGVLYRLGRWLYRVEAAVYRVEHSVNHTEVPLSHTVENLSVSIDRMSAALADHATIDAQRFDRLDAQVQELEGYNRDRWHKDDNRYATMFGMLQLIYEEMVPPQKGGEP